MYKILIACYGQETNTFNPMTTKLEAFGDPEKFLESADFSRLRGTNAAFYEVLSKRTDVQVIPGLYAWAQPWGRCERSAHEHIKGELLRLCRQEERIDAVLLSLHGAMALDDDDDAEGDLLAALRAELGEGTPIAAILDLHANITEKMLKNANILINYHTYPHIDADQRGREAAALLLDTLDGKIRPLMQARKLPLLCEFLPSAHPVINGFQQQCRQFEQEPGVLSVSIAYGFFCADIYESGVCILAITDQNAQQGQSILRRIGDDIWQQRQSLLREYVDLDYAIDQALAQPELYPVVFADCWDNPGGGAPGDNTHILRRLLERRVKGALIAYMRSPETVAQAEKAGVGACIEVSIGGKFFPELCGAAIKKKAWVKSLSNGVYDPPGKLSRDFRRIGKLAALIIDDMYVIVSSGFAQTWSEEGIRACGIDPASCSIIVVKSSVHFRHAFEKIAGRIYDVEVPGKSEQKIANLNFVNCKRPIFPLDPMEG